MLLAKSLTGEELARQLIVCLSTELGISSDMLLASMHDRSSVNYAAMHTLNIVFPKVFDIACFSHTLDHVGEYFKTPILDEFMKVPKIKLQLLFLMLLRTENHKLSFPSLLMQEKVL